MWRKIKDASRSPLFASSSAFRSRRHIYLATHTITTFKAIHHILHHTVSGLAVQTDGITVLTDEDVQEFLDTLLCSFSATSANDLFITDPSQNHIVTVSLNDDHRKFAHKHLLNAGDESKESSPFAVAKPGKFTKLLEAGDDAFREYILSEMAKSKSLITDLLEKSSVTVQFMEA